MESTTHSWLLTGAIAGSSQLGGKTGSTEFDCKSHFRMALKFVASCRWFQSIQTQQGMLVTGMDDQAPGIVNTADLTKLSVG